MIFFILADFDHCNLVYEQVVNKNLSDVHHIKKVLIVLVILLVVYSFVHVNFRVVVIVYRCILIVVSNLQIFILQDVEVIKDNKDVNLVVLLYDHELLAIEKLS